VKILHENLLFPHKTLKNFLGEEAQSPAQTPPLPFRAPWAYSKIMDPPPILLVPVSWKLQ